MGLNKQEEYFDVHVGTRFSRNRPTFQRSQDGKVDQKQLLRLRQHLMKVPSAIKVDRCFKFQVNSRSQNSSTGDLEEQEPSNISPSRFKELKGIQMKKLFITPEDARKQYDQTEEEIILDKEYENITNTIKR